MIQQKIKCGRTLKKPKKKKIKRTVEIFVIAILVITVGILGVICFNDIKQSKPNNYVRTSLSEGLKTEYNKGYTEEDKLAVQPIMKQVDVALHYVGGENSAIKNLINYILYVQQKNLIQK